MNNLQEAYLSVYEATAMAKRGLDEPAIRQQIAKNTSGGGSADRATTLADKQTYGQSGVNPQARQRLAATQRGDFHKTASSNPGLHGYAHKATNPADKAKQDARGAQRGVLTPNEKKQLNREETDLFDYLLEYLVAEGYADTNDAAIAIMSNMSEEWKQSIVEAWEPITPKRKAKIDLKKETVRQKENIARYQDKPLDVQKQYTRGKALEFQKPMREIGMRR
jgi:hypothetical protein